MHVCTDHKSTKQIHQIYWWMFTLRDWVTGQLHFWPLFNCSCERTKLSLIPIHRKYMVHVCRRACKFKVGYKPICLLLISNIVHFKWLWQLNPLHQPCMPNLPIRIEEINCRCYFWLLLHSLLSPSHWIVSKRIEHTFSRRPYYHVHVVCRTFGHKKPSM